MSWQDWMQVCSVCLPNLLLVCLSPVLLS